MTPPEIEIIAPADARARLLAAIEARLGADWAREDAWIVVHNSDYLMRLHRGTINLDFACDLLGEVTVTEQPADPVQTSGRLVAGAVLAAWLAVALVIARVAGVI